MKTALLTPELNIDIQQVKQNTFSSFDEFKQFVRDAFINGSGINSELFEACIEFHQDIEIDYGGEVSTPIHDELNWKYIRFGKQAKEPMYAALFKNEDGSTWQAILSIWDEDKQRPYKYLAPTGNGDKIFLPPIPPLIRNRIAAKYGVDVPKDGSFWKWLETQDKLPRILSEGGKKGLSGLSLGYILLSLYGCQSGAPTKDKDGNRINPKPIPDLSRFALEHTIWLFALDRDEKESAKTTVNFAKKRLTQALQRETSKCFCEDIFWKPEQGKGLDDLVVKSGSGSFDGAYTRALIRLEKQFKSNGLIIQDNETIKKPPADKIAEKIAEDYRQTLIYNNETKHWMRYQAEAPGVWSQETDDYTLSIVYKIIKSEGISGFEASYVTSILKILGHELIQRKWGEMSPLEFIPFTNGVLEVATGKLLPHSPHYRFTWQLPRQYSQIAGDWSKIDTFLTHLANNNQQIKEMLICYCNAVLKGRCELQKFLHLIGVGGTGKGSYGRLLVSLVGKQNVYTTTLDDWCHNQFEAANAYGKRLVMFPDEDKQMGKIGKFLNLTGQDELRAEEKNKKAFTYRYDGMVLLMSNFPIFVGDSASRVKRRVITVPCNNPVVTVNSNLESELDAELSAFTNYLLTLSDEFVTKTLTGVKDNPICTLEFWEGRMRVDSIAAWLNQHVIYDPATKTQVGADRSEGDNSTPVTLFGSYNQYMKKAGGTPTSHKNFSPNVIELCNSILGWKVERHVTKTGKFVKGLRLREPGDEGIPTYDYVLMQKVKGEENNFEDNQDSKPSPPSKSNQGNNSEPSPEPTQQPSPDATLLNEGQDQLPPIDEQETTKSNGDGYRDGLGDGSESQSGKGFKPGDGSLPNLSAEKKEEKTQQTKEYKPVNVKLASTQGDIKVSANPQGKDWNINITFPDGDVINEFLKDANSKQVNKHLQLLVDQWNAKFRYTVQVLEGIGSTVPVANCTFIKMTVSPANPNKGSWLFETPQGKAVFVYCRSDWQLQK